MNVDEITDETLEQLDLENETFPANPETLIKTAFQVYVDQRLPEVEEQLAKYEGTQFTEFGKIKLLEEIQDL